MIGEMTWETEELKLPEGISLITEEQAKKTLDEIVKSMGVLPALVTVWDSCPKGDER